LIAAAGCSQTAKVQTSSAAARTKVPAPVPDGYRVVKDLPYYPEGFRPLSGDAEYAAERCKLDIYTPKNIEKPLPVLIFFHGGGLSRGTKTFPRPHRGLPADIVIVTPNYRLSGPRAKCPDYLNDAAAAAAWTIRNIRKYGGDPEKVFVSGHSAGGYLSAMIGLDPRWMKPHGLDPRKCFAGVLPVSGQMSTHFQIMIERGQAGQTVIDDFAPIYHASTDTPPIVLFCGQADIEFKARVAENQFFHDVLTQLKNNRKTKIFQLNGFTHGTVAYPAAYLTRQEIKKILLQKKAAEKSKNQKPASTR
ncbi:MAG: alpha/beta hydrolase, partial [Lentisphaeria bacterium]|nr:alpha/beta hydrolase [Lentisphaeria bacterium]